MREVSFALGYRRAFKSARSSNAETARSAVSSPRKTLRRRAEVTSTSQKSQVARTGAPAMWSLTDRPSPGESISQSTTADASRINCWDDELRALVATSAHKVRARHATDASSSLNPRAELVDRGKGRESLKFDAQILREALASEGRTCLQLLVSFWREFANLNGSHA